MSTTSIEWTLTVNADGTTTKGMTWNPVRGCTKVSAGCKNCYAETFSERWRGIKGHPFEQGFDLRLVPEALSKPLTWKKPRRIFVNSMSDLFHEDVPFEYVAAVFGVMAACPQHTFQVLTKRPERAAEFFEVYRDDPRMWAMWCLNAASYVMKDSPALMGWRVGVHERLESHGWRPLPNVHLGVSCENQETADQRIPLLMKCPAVVRFVSAEPLLGPIEFDAKHLGQGSDCPEDGWMVRVDEDGCCISCGKDAMWYGVDWVIVGGESGPGARPCDLSWIRSIVQQCKAAAAAVPVFVKQLGAVPVIADPPRVGLPRSEWPEMEWPDGTFFGNRTGRPELNGVVALLRDRKGGDMAEFPVDLQVREYPAVSA